MFSARRCRRFRPSVTEIVSSACFERSMPGRLQLLVEGNVRSADHVGEDHVGLGQLDLVDHRIELGVAERVIFFGRRLWPFSTFFDMLARESLFEVARPDVVRTDEEERTFATLLLGDPVSGRQESAASLPWPV